MDNSIFEAARSPQHAPVAYAPIYEPCASPLALRSTPRQCFRFAACRSRCVASEKRAPTPPGRIGVVATITQHCTHCPPAFPTSFVSLVTFVVYTSTCRHPPVSMIRDYNRIVFLFSQPLASGERGAGAEPPFRTCKFWLLEIFSLSSFICSS